MSSPSKFTLSVCIPTYNRSASLLPLVNRLLSCSDPDIEVVVLDNASTDGTLDVLGQVRDERLSVHVNPVNRGVLYNILNVIDKAQGRFAVLLLDKDNVDPLRLPALRDFLCATPNLACGYCEYHSPVAEEAVVYEAGMPALRAIAYVGHHPTGYFFSTERLRSLDCLRRFADFEVVGHFPFDFMFAELLHDGRGAVYHRPVFSPESEANAARFKSIGTNAAREDAFFSPEGRRKTAIAYGRHLATLPISPAEKRVLAGDRYVQGLVAATLSFRSLMRNEALCAHYHIATRHVGWNEMLVAAARFHRTFVAQVLEPSSIGGNGLRTVVFKTRVVARVLRVAVGHAARRLLKPLRQPGHS